MWIRGPRRSSKIQHSLQNLEIFVFLIFWQFLLIFDSQRISDTESQIRQIEANIQNLRKQRFQNSPVHDFGDLGGDNNNDLDHSPRSVKPP